MNCYKEFQEKSFKNKWGVGGNLFTKETEPTWETVEQAQSGSVCPILVDHAFLSSFGYRNGESDGFVELAATWLDRHDGADRHTITKKLSNKFRCNWLGLADRRK